MGPLFLWNWVTHQNGLPALRRTSCSIVDDGSGAFKISIAILIFLIFVSGTLSMLYCMLGRQAESCVHRVVRQIGWINIILQFNISNSVMVWTTSVRYNLIFYFSLLYIKEYCGYFFRLIEPHVICKYHIMWLVSESDTSMYHYPSDIAAPPLGTIIPWMPAEPSDSAPPGWAICDGSVVTNENRCECGPYNNIDYLFFQHASTKE